MAQYPMAYVERSGWSREVIDKLTSSSSQPDYTQFSLLTTTTNDSELLQLQLQQQQQSSLYRPIRLLNVIELKQQTSHHDRITTIVPLGSAYDTVVHPIFPFTKIEPKTTQPRSKSKRPRSKSTGDRRNIEEDDNYNNNGNPLLFGITTKTITTIEKTTTVIEESGSTGDKKTTITAKKQMKEKPDVTIIQVLGKQ